MQTCQDLLTPREIQLLNLLAKGLVYKQIGNEMHIEINTVKNHTKALRGKLNADTNSQVIYIAMKIGLLQ